MMKTPMTKKSRKALFYAGARAVLLVIKQLRGAPAGA